MKKIRIIALSMVLLFSANFLVSCYGSFALTKKVYEWNGTVGDPLVNTLVMWGLIIIPVYEVAALADFWILNTIEHWTGSNPLAMKEGDKEIKIVKKNGKSIKITASKNRFDVQVLNGNDAGKKASMFFNEKETAWYMESAEKSIKLVSLSDNKINLFLNGEVVTLGATEIHSVAEARSIFNSLNAVAVK